MDEQRPHNEVSESAAADVADTLQGQTIIRHEEELRVQRRVEEAGAVHARKRLETHRVEELVPRGVEAAEVERTGPNENDSGEVETLSDGSISVPVFEEEVVVTKRTIVRERVVIRRDLVTERHAVETELLKEQVEMETDPGLEAADDTAGGVRR